MRSLVLSLMFALLAPAQAPERGPFGFWIQNAAFLGAPIAPGSLIAVSAYGDFRYDLPNLKLRLTASSGTSYSLPVIAPPSGSQRGGDTTVWSMIPTAATAGPAHIDLESGSTKLTVALNVTMTGPGLFTKNYNGTGPALAFNQTGAVNALTAAAVPNREVALFATGLNGARATDVTVELAGKIVPANFAGSQETWPGLDQINFTLPADAHLGCYVPVAIRVRGVLSNYASLSIHTDSFACAHPLSLRYDELQTLDRGGIVRMGMFRFDGDYTFPDQSEEYANFANFGMAANLAASFAGLQMPDSVYFSCDAPLGLGFFYRALTPQEGPFTIFGPGGQQTFSLGESWHGTGAAFYRSGTWQLSASATADTSGFTQSFWVAPTVRAANAQMQGEDLVITWDGAGFVPGDVFTIALYSTDERSRSCNAPASAGRLVVPSAVVRDLQPLRSEISWNIHPHPAVRPTFRLPRRDGSTIPAMIDYAHFLNGQPLLR